MGEAISSHGTYNSLRWANVASDPGTMNLILLLLRSLMKQKKCQTLDN